MANSSTVPQRMLWSGPQLIWKLACNKEEKLSLRLFIGNKKLKSLPFRYQQNNSFGVRWNDSFPWFQRPGSKLFPPLICKRTGKKPWNEVFITYQNFEEAEGMTPGIGGTQIIYDTGKKATEIFCERESPSLQALSLQDRAFGAFHAICKPFVCLFKDMYLNTVIR